MKQKRSLLYNMYMAVFLLLLLASMFQSILEKQVIQLIILLLFFLFIRWGTKDKSYKALGIICIVGISFQGIGNVIMTDFLPFLSFAGRTITASGFFSLLVLLILLYQTIFTEDIRKSFLPFLNTKVRGAIFFVLVLVIVPHIIWGYTSINSVHILISLEYLSIANGIISFLHTKHYNQYA